MNMIKKQIIETQRILFASNFNLVACVAFVSLYLAVYFSLTLTFTQIHPPYFVFLSHMLLLLCFASSKMPIFSNYFIVLSLEDFMPKLFNRQYRDFILMRNICHLIPFACRSCQWRCIFAFSYPQESIYIYLQL